MGLRDEKKREMRSAILDTALSLYRREGFESTRVRDIVNRLRISEATFFNYFETKHSVLEAAAEQLVHRSLEQLETAVALDTPISQRLECLVDAFATEFSGDRELAALLAAHTTFFAGAREERLVLAHGLLRDLFADGQERGEIRTDLTAALLAELALAMMLAVIHDWSRGADDDQPLDAQLRAASDVLLQGCAAPRR